VETKPLSKTDAGGSIKRGKDQGWGVGISRCSKKGRGEINQVQRQQEIALAGASFQSKITQRELRARLGQDVFVAGVGANRESTKKKPL